MNLLDRIANYFKEWDGIDETAPKMELSIHDLRYIASMNIERCRLLKKVNEANQMLAESKDAEKNAWTFLTDDEESYPEVGVYVLIEDDCSDKNVAYCVPDYEWYISNGEDSLKLIGNVVKWRKLTI